jgi:SAM-dependent methyltransferase
MFPHDELRYYFFGLHAGLANVRANGLRLGIKKTVGKVTQPINAPSRFPEYACFDAAIREHGSRHSDRRLAVLDVGSPKLIGLHLAYATAARMVLTDITDLNLHEYRAMWGGLQPRAKGQVAFSRLDARALPFRAGQFDVVYSMSVVEHIEGSDGDSRAVREFIRVLQPAGLLVLSVPFGRQYIEQGRIGFAGAARPTGDTETYFFQRIYDRDAFQSRILDAAQGLERLRLTTIARVRPSLARAFGALGENARGLLGFLNPLLSAAINRRRSGMDDDFEVSYGPLHSARDVYGDVILVGQKQS